MNNPYGVLGIGRDASEEEIKKTYKTLSRKYHPDANINNPNQEQAEEKFKEIQAAYQQIMKERTEGYQGDGSYGGGYGNAQDPFGSGPFGYGPFGSGPFGGFQGRYQQADTGYEENSRLRAAGNYLRNGYYREAHTTLEGMSTQERNARWYYYSAIANSGLGNNVVALEHARRAVAMEPHNMSYQSLLQRFESGGNWYAQRQATYGYPKNQGSDICVKLCWANMLLSLCSGCGGCYGGRCI